MRRTAHFMLIAAMVFLLSGPRPGVAGQDQTSTVQVTGDVLYPGAYPLIKGMTALDVLAQAGGSPSDSEHSVIVRRNATSRDGYDMIKYKHDERLRDNDMLIVRGSYVLRPDELLLIDVEGHPRISGRYVIQDDKSVILPTGERLIVGSDPDFRVHIAQAITTKLPGSPKVTVTVAPFRGPRTERKSVSR